MPRLSSEGETSALCVGTYVLRQQDFRGHHRNPRPASPGSTTEVEASHPLCSFPNRTRQPGQRQPAPDPHQPDRTPALPPPPPPPRRHTPSPPRPPPRRRPPPPPPQPPQKRRWPLVVAAR